jgi:hypothetical protein
MEVFPVGQNIYLMYNGLVYFLWNIFLIFVDCYTFDFMYNWKWYMYDLLRCTATSCYNK